MLTMSDTPSTASAPRDNANERDRPKHREHARDPEQHERALREQRIVTRQAPPFRMLAIIGESGVRASVPGRGIAITVRRVKNTHVFNRTPISGRMDNFPGIFPSLTWPRRRT